MWTVDLTGRLTQSQATSIEGTLLSITNHIQVHDSTAQNQERYRLHSTGVVQV
jgi:hypothetical protein